MNILIKKIIQLINKGFSQNRSLLLIMLITGCSTPEIPIHYYSLNTITPEHSLFKVTEQVAIDQTLPNKQIIIRKVDMADFLKTGGIVMQIASHQLQLSQNHLWADKLPRAISVNLIRHLAMNKQQPSVSDKVLHYSNITPYIIDIFFEQFTITTNQTVISGYFTINDKNNSKREFFDIRQPLTQDGYNHAIESFQQSLTELATTIIESTNP